MTIHRQGHDVLLTTDDIYEAAFIPEVWPRVLEGIRTVADSWGTAIITIDPRQTYRFLATEDYAPLIQRFAENSTAYENVRPRRGLARRHNGFLTDLDVCTPEELLRDPMYVTFYRPSGIGFTAGSVLPLPSGDMLVFDLVRAAEKGPYDAATVARLDALRPDLARAGVVAARLGLERARTTAMTLSALGIPAAVLQFGGRVLAMNPEFEAFPHVTTRGRDRIGLSHSAADALLEEALSRLEAGAVQRVSSIPVPARDATPAIVLHLVPVRRQARDLFAAAAAVLIATPITAPDAPMTEMLNVLFDLTPGEARLARALFSGLTLQQAAADFGLSEQTLRSRLKAVFSKTGTSRQTDLIRMLTGLTPHVRF